MNEPLSENIVKYIKIEVLTPVHIGAGPDKKWMNDIDYVYDNSCVIVFDLAELLKNIDEDFINKIADDFINKVTNKQKKEETSIFKEEDIKKHIRPKIQYQFNREPDEIFAHIRTGLGQIIIPGSSLKGAITSALLGYLYKNDEDIRRLGRTSDIDQRVFGKTENSVMRLVQITDAIFEYEDAELFNTKIYSLNINKKGQWKHQRRGSIPEFDSNSFVSTYECLKKGSISFTRINIIKNIIDNLPPKNKPEYLEKIIKINNADPITELFKMINEQTISYLKKEIKFFEQHEGDQSEAIIESLNELQETAENCQNKECVLHLGSGSGFHGITGDWQFKDHIITSIREIKNKEGKVISSRGQINGKDAAKTRRLIFEDKGGNNFEFYPMGYVKLSVVDERNCNDIIEGIKEKHTKSNFTKKYENNKSEIKNPHQLSGKEQVITKLSEVAQNRMVIAEIVKIEKNNSVARICLEDKEMECKLQGKDLKKYKPGDKVFAKITSIKENLINTVSINIK